MDRTLGPGEAVIFNVPRAMEAMFYSRFMAYSRMPGPAEVEALHARGTRLVIFVPAGETLEVPADWRAERLAERVR